VYLLTLLRQFATTVAATAAGIAHAVMHPNESQAQLKPGDPAPDFLLPGSDGRTYRLKDLAGRPVVVAWFPKAFTGG
jgi:peroxiredoxin